MKQKKQKGNNPRTTDKKKQPGSVKKNTPRKRAKRGQRMDTGIKISMMGTQKVDRDTVLNLCSKVINDTKGIAMNQATRHPNQLKDNRDSSRSKNKKGGGKPALKETPSKPQKDGEKGVAMNYKDLKKLRKKQAEKEAAAKEAAKADRERVLAKKGPLEITAKMIKAAKEKEAHKQGILHLWGRPGSGAFKERRKRGGKR